MYCTGLRNNMTLAETHNFCMPILGHIHVHYRGCFEDEIEYINIKNHDSG